MASNLDARPHDILTTSMDSTSFRKSSALLLVAGILVSLLALSSTASASELDPAAATPRATLRATATGRAAGATPTATAVIVDKSQPGSTDGLMLMSFAIVLIVVIPILVQRALYK